MAAVAGAGGLPVLRRGVVPLLSPAGEAPVGLGVALSSARPCGGGVVIGIWHCPKCGLLYTAIKDYLGRPTAPASCQSCRFVPLLPLATVPEKGE